MIFPKKTIILTESTSLKPNELRKTETFVANGRKYRITRGDDYIALNREYLDIFDVLGFERLKFYFTAKGNLHPEAQTPVAILTVEIKKGIKYFYISSGIFMLIATVYGDITFGTFATGGIIIFYGLLYLLLYNSFNLFHEELTIDLKYR